MEDIQKKLTLGFLVVLLIAFLAYLGRVKVKHDHHQCDRVRLVARVGVFGALSAILYIVPIFQIKLLFLPSFLELHFDEIPAFLAGFAYGPVAGALVILIKTILKLPFTSTLCVGELSDLIYSLAFVVPASIVYEKKRNLKGVAQGLLLSTMLQLIVSVVTNIYIMLPFYMNVMGLPYDLILGWCQAANPNVTNLEWGYGLLCVLPLNLIKDAIVIVVTFFVYRHIHTFLRFEKPSKSPSK